MPFVDTGAGPVPATGDGLANPATAPQSQAEAYLWNGASWERGRTPNTFRTVAATALGNTALWTPAAGKKFRLMGVLVQVTNNAILAAGAVVTIALQDGAVALGVTFSVFIPTAAAASGPELFDSGWLTLGNGFLSAAANNVLNVNLSVALTGGTVRAIACGTEE